MSTSVYIQRDYGIFCVFGRRENKANLADPKGVEQKPVDDGRSFIVPHPSSFQPLSRGCQLINRFKRQIDRLIASFFLKERRNAKIILMWGFFLDGAG